LTSADEQVLIGAVDDGGSPRGLIVTEDEVIRAWAEETIDDYLTRAEQISPEDAGVRAVPSDGGT
jgi:hypothetical protein